MKIVIAPDSFKESLTALEVADAIEAGFRSVLPYAEYLKVPVADGGEGTVQSLVDATGGEFVSAKVTAPLGNRVTARYGILGHGNSAVIEMAEASGLHLVPAKSRDPRITTSFGTGELIFDALDKGIRHIIIGLGGSATNDCGAGMLQALGISLLDKTGQPIGYGGAELARLDKILFDKVHPLLEQCGFEIACDVNNPLCGCSGASAVFGPQKGATPEVVTELDSALAHFASTLHCCGIKTDQCTPGAGAAGGMGFATLAFLRAELKPGIKLVTDAVGLKDKMAGADLVITGEGRMDGQSVHGKTPVGVASLARELNIPVVGIAGCFGQGVQQVFDYGIDAIFPIIPGIISLESALQNAAENLQMTSRNIAALWELGRASK